MIFILLAAAVLSVAISIYQLLSPSVTEKPTTMEIISDPAIIVAVVILIAVIGTVQENTAQNEERSDPDKTRRQYEYLPPLHFRIPG